jgi:hypothetical protein
MIKLGRMNWAGHLAYTEAKRDAYRVFGWRVRWALYITVMECAGMKR